MDTIKVAMIGFGGVNRAFVDLALRHNAKSENTSRIRIVAISDLRAGSVFDDDGIDLDVLNTLSSDEGVFSSVRNGQGEADTSRLISSVDCDVALEAAYSNVKTGEPGISFCEALLKRGISVATTNKGTTAFGVPRLVDLAKTNACQFRFEGAVMSGTPVLEALSECFIGAEKRSIRGILNGTTNYVLGQMETGCDFDEALQLAKSLGYAEADPRSDIEGFDAQLKTLILANLYFGCELTPEDVPVSGIQGLGLGQIKSAAQQGKRWKLIGSITQLSPGQIDARVQPEMIGSDDPLFGVSGANNAIALQSDPLGDTLISGAGAGRVETAYALYADMLRINKGTA